MVTSQVYLLITLVTSHIAGDFLFQTKSDVLNKNSGPVFIKHILVITLLAYLFLGIWSNWSIPLIIAVTHFIIDKIKLKTNQAKLNEPKSFVLDQAAHIIVIVVIVLIFSHSVNIDSSFWMKEFGDSYLKFNIYLSGLILTVITGGIIIGMVVKTFLEQIENEQKGLKNGGELIGRLERLLIFFFIILGNMTVVGFLIAAKSIFRFGELNDSENRKQAEYILIGTLYSFSLGFVVSWITKELVNLI